MRKLSTAGTGVNDLLSGEKVCVTHRPTVQYSSLSLSLCDLYSSSLSLPPPSSNRLSYYLKVLRQLKYQLIQKMN